MSVSAILREVMFNRETALVDPDADNKAIDADEALRELGADDVAFGYLGCAGLPQYHFRASDVRYRAGHNDLKARVVRSNIQIAQPMLIQTLLQTR
jgi:hypothetical protein